MSVPGTCVLMVQQAAKSAICLLHLLPRRMSLVKIRPIPFSSYPEFVGLGLAFESCLAVATAQTLRCSRESGSSVAQKPQLRISAALSASGLHLVGIREAQQRDVPPPDSLHSGTKHLGCISSPMRRLIKILHSRILVKGIRLIRLPPLKLSHRLSGILSFSVRMGGFFSLLLSASVRESPTHGPPAVEILEGDGSGLGPRGSWVGLGSDGWV